MLISYDMDGKSARRRWSKPMLLLAGINSLVAVTMLAGWTFVSLFIAEPIEWATWMRVSRGSNFMDAFDYPFVLLWALPAGGITLAWIGTQSSKRGMAYASLTMPMVILGFMVGWFYLTPETWR